jgi:hypothetical protein
VSVYPTQRNQQPRPERGDWDHSTDDAKEPTSRSCTGIVVFLLLLLSVAVLCVTGFFLARLLLSKSSPATLPVLLVGTSSPLATGPAPEITVPAGTLGQARLAITPEQGYINTLVTVSGQGWWPGEPVYVFLRSPVEGDNAAYAYAAAVTDDGGSFQTALTFPNELRWIGQEWAEVNARGTRSGLEAGARFTLVAPTPTDTSPPPTAAPTYTPSNTPPPTDTPQPTDTPHPTPTPTPDVVITDWLGEYFANPTLAGNPVFIRNDVTIDFNWGAGSPGPGIPVEQFSVRWTRRLRFSEGLYRFSVVADDGVRFWIDGQLYIDEWHDGTMTEYSFDLDLLKGRHNLQLEYYENLGGAMIQFKLSQIESPTSTPPPTDTPPPISRPLPDSWRAEYYANPGLFGRPALVREEAAIDFDWGSGSPDESIPVDDFSARWLGQQTMSEGTYRYSLVADDGARLWIDGQLVIDAWMLGPGQVQVAEVYLANGVHAFQVDYFEVIVDAYIHLSGEKR